MNKHAPAGTLHRPNRGRTPDVRFQLVARFADGRVAVLVERWSSLNQAPKRYARLKTEARALRDAGIHGDAEIEITRQFHSRVRRPFTGE